MLRWGSRVCVGGDTDSMLWGRGHPPRKAEPAPPAPRPPPPLRPRQPPPPPPAARQVAGPAPGPVTSGQLVGQGSACGSATIGGRMRLKKNTCSTHERQPAVEQQGGRGCRRTARQCQAPAGSDSATGRQREPTASLLIQHTRSNRPGSRQTVDQTLSTGRQ